MTGVTVNRGVTAGQREEIMIKNTAIPGVYSVAGFAVSRQKTGRGVLRV